MSRGPIGQWGGEGWDGEPSLELQREIRLEIGPELAVVPTIEELTHRVEAELREALGAREMPLYRMMSYHLGWEDERGDTYHTFPVDRPHGAACLAACLAVGGDLDAAAPVAASVELVSSFAQIHDDIQGGQPQRNGRDAVWWVWGPAQGINAGDGMHAVARLSVLRLQARGSSPETTFRALQLLDQASLELCEGRFRDLEAQERIDLDVGRYLEMATAKTGALYSAAMKLGGLVSAANNSVLEALGECGSKMGVALQVREDLRELWDAGSDGAPPSSEVLNKKKMLPVVYAMEKATIKEKRRLGDIYFKRVLEPDDVVTLRGILEELGAKSYCQDQVARYRGEAEAALAVPGLLPEGVAAIRGVMDSLLGPS